MMADIVDTLKTVGPFVLVMWIVTLVSVAWKPQRYFNSFLLMGSIISTMVFLAGFFGDYAGLVLLGCFLVIMLGLFLTPALLILNGITMIKKESFSPAHVLSLVLGIVVLIGEIAAAFYVLGLAYSTGLEKVNSWILFIAMTVFYFSYLVLSFVIYSVFIQIMPRRADYDYLIVHGCALSDGEHPGRLLAARLDKAVEVYGKCEVPPIIIPSGGRGSDEKLSEAESMKNYLTERGIPEDHIIMEDRSTTTEDNVIFSGRIVRSREGGRRIALISSNYHVYRCLRIAAREGLKCTGIGAKVAAYYWPSALIREFAAVFFNKGFFIWSMIGYLLFVSPILLKWF